MFQRNALKLLAAALLLSACAPITSNSDSPKQVKLHISAESYIVKLTKKANALRPGEKEELDQYLAHLGDLKNVEFSIRRTHKGMALASLAPVEKELVRHGADPRRIFRLAEIGVDYQGEWSVLQDISDDGIVLFDDFCLFQLGLVVRGNWVGSFQGLRVLDGQHILNLIVDQQSSGSSYFDQADLEVGQLP